ncbi:MAG: polysaccharide deacetylase family protein [Lachnospiraceae bacterium]
MKRKKKSISPRKRRYKRICQLLTLILVLLLAALTVIFLYQKKEALEKEKAKIEAEEKRKIKEKEDKEAKEAIQKAAEAAQKKEEDQKAAEAAAAIINKDVQTAENTATEANHKTNGLAICMYHYVYDKDNPPKEELNSNFIEVHDLEEELKYLVENNYYFPTWEEVQQYVEGNLLLPEKSVVLTFDDGAYSFLNLGVPLFNKYKIPVTSFLIGNIDGEKKVKKYSSEYLTFQSHSYNMHRAGGNIGHGGIFPVMDHDEAVADLEKSIEVSGNSDAFAYPYGDYNDNCVQAVKDAGFKCAVTTEYGRAKPGDDPLLLPRVRMSRGQSLESFKKLVE